MHLLRTAVLLTIPVAGLIALIALEVIRGASGGGLPPVAMLTGIVCLSALPVILLATSAGALARWVSFGIALLMSLFHALHILEHAAAPDFGMAMLILITMFAPSFLAAVQLWTSRNPAPAQAEQA
ncbi:MAG: hypothetical protein AAGE85_00485 [Pseudomonadota bacterium]